MESAIELPQEQATLQPAQQPSAPPASNNREALAELDKERNALTNHCYGLGFGSLAVGSINPLWWIVGIGALMLPLKHLRKTSQLFLTMESLLEAFEEQEVQITPRLEIPENGSLDFFVRFPNPPKAVFTIGLRSNGNSTVIYKPEREALYSRRKQGGKPWQVDLFRRFALQEFWLRKNQTYLFGQSSKDRNRPAVKLLVLTGNTRLGSHPEHLYAMIGDQKVVVARNRITIYILEEQQLIPFIRAWLAQQ